IFVSIEKLVSAADPKALQSWNDFGKRDQTWRRPLTDFFAREYRRYRPNEPNPVLFSIPEPKSDAPSISWQGSLFNELLPFDEMNRFHGLKNVAPAPNLGVVFVHLYARSESGTSPYPLEHQGKRPDRTGIVYLPLLSKAEGESLARLAHEVGHAMGAKDKTDDHGFAVYPRGYPNPFRDPLHPQTSGELMTRGIAQTAKQYKPFSSLNEIQIGAHTAAEFGWISKESAERFYRGKK
ncbi:MAG TPA: hypothetical protein VI895_10560, partial [Bdellovibrionota bacterium]|nr:hypothetical protein [Bdellovibrionota bacterium]